MRDKKGFISAILLTTVILFAAACGKQAEPVSAEPTEPIKEVDTEKWNKGLHKKVNHLIDEESMESSEVDTIEEDGATAEDNVAVREEIVAEETESTKIESTETTANENTSDGTKPSENTSNGTTSEQSVLTDTAPAQSAPTHEHTWVAHNATKQVWVPNIVIVDDYEYQYVESYLFHCNECGFETTSRDAIAEHVYATYHGFAINDFSHYEQVKVGSHEEDQGHYETSTYVDYYYCECGATKN